MRDQLVNYVPMLPGPTLQNARPWQGESAAGLGDASTKANSLVLPQRPFFWTWAMHMLALSGLLALGTVTGRRVGGEEWADALRV